MIPAVDEATADHLAGVIALLVVAPTLRLVVAAATTLLAKMTVASVTTTGVIETALEAPMIGIVK